MNLIQQNKVLYEYLSHLHDESESELYSEARSQFKGDDEAFALLVKQYGDLAPEKKAGFLKSHNFSLQNPSLSLAISPEMGEFLFNLAVLNKPKLILELGSSIGVSTLYFAEALRINGGGHIIATEMQPEKCVALRTNVREMRLNKFVELQEGDVFETVRNLQDSIDFLFIDIWADGYLDIFKEVESLLKPGSIVVADNMYTAFDEVQPFKSYLNKKLNICNTTLAFESGVEFAVVI